MSNTKGDVQVVERLGGACLQVRIRGMQTAVCEVYFVCEVQHDGENFVLYGTCFTR